MAASRSPPSLSLLAKLFTPLRYSATFELSKKVPLHLPRYLSFIALQQMISKDAFTAWRFGPPNFLGITAPFCLVVPTLNLTLLALIISSSNVSLSLSWTFLFPLSTNLGNFFLLILMLRTRTSLNNTLLLPRTCPRSCSTPPSNPPCYITGAKDTGPLIRYGPFSIKSLRPNPASLQLSINH